MKYIIIIFIISLLAFFFDIIASSYLHNFLREVFGINIDRY